MTADIAKRMLGLVSHPLRFGVQRVALFRLLVRIMARGQRRGGKRKQNRTNHGRSVSPSNRVRQAAPMRGSGRTLTGVIETQSEEEGTVRKAPRLRRAKRQTLNVKLSTSKARRQTLDRSSWRRSRRL